ncbi:MAG TPA: hypothetical protein VH601_00550 [Bryobacteraceae bacterium]|jgi:hypothetical protein
MPARLRLPPWLFLLALAVGVAALLFSIDFYRHRIVRSNADLVRLLPPGDSTIFFANFAVLRRAGMLRLLAGAKPAEEKDYAEFVRQTGFDYTKDVDALAGAVGRNGLFFVARGRFDWDSLQRYVRNCGGSCSGDEFCSIQTSNPERWASLVAIQPGVIGLAVAGNGSSARSLRPSGRRNNQSDVSEPVWMHASRELLKNPVEMPLPLRIFAITLQSAESVVISLGAAEQSGQAAFEIRLDALCPNRVTADTIRNQLELQTKLLRLELTRERQKPSPADLTGLLTSGSFQVVDQRVVGRWPVRNELLRTLQ